MKYLPDVAKNKSMIRKFFDKLALLAEKKVRENGEQYTAFGLFVLVTYPIYHFFWIYFSVQPYSNFSLRIVAATLCLFLALNKHWPQKLKKYLPLYWYCTLLFCLPFFFTFMLIENGFSSIWFTNSILGLYFLMLLVDFRSFIFLFFLGALLGILSAYLIPPPLDLSGPIDYFGIIITYAVSLVIGGMFARNREEIEATKINTARALSATVAHELRTPLSTIQAASKRAQYLLPKLLEKDISAEEIQENFENLKGAINDIIEETQSSNTAINMILVNVKQDQENHPLFHNLQINSMNSCISDAIARYPFQAGEINLIKWNSSNDFVFNGDKMVVVHILFNLIKNALYFIQAEKKGSIAIWSEVLADKNILYFKDTAKGIPAHELSKLFERFYTTTRHGTGLGLAYCKVAMSKLGGSISCQSKMGEFAQFEMIFPKTNADVDLTRIFHDSATANATKPISSST